MIVGLKQLQPSRFNPLPLPRQEEDHTFPLLYDFHHQAQQKVFFSLKKKLKRISFFKFTRMTWSDCCQSTKLLSSSLSSATPNKENVIVTLHQTVVVNIPNFCFHHYQ
jgi:hypothetical protein